MSQMRLLMHATDPDKGEPRLGRTDSKGCVRISSALNRFLDTYAILDSNYEDWAKTRSDSWLLKKDRMPVAYPGKYLIVGDSAVQHQAASRAQPDVSGSRKIRSREAPSCFREGKRERSRLLLFFPHLHGISSSMNPRRGSMPGAEESFSRF